LPHGILHVFNTILYEIEFQNPQIQSFSRAFYFKHALSLSLHEYWKNAVGIERFRDTIKNVPMEQGFFDSGTYCLSKLAGNLKSDSFSAKQTFEIG
jgi:hypothetical protein